jgi:hypothetical protein
MSDKVGMAIRELRRAEADLAAQLLRMSDRHKADHEIFHVARDIARWSQEHVRELARVGKDYGLELDPEPAGDSALATVRQKGSELLGRHHDPALLLLADLREVHRTAAGVSLDWEILAQTAQALKDRELLAVSQDCHPETLRQMRWANAQLKVQSAQTMVS